MNGNACDYCKVVAANARLKCRIAELEYRLEAATKAATTAWSPAHDVALAAAEEREACARIADACACDGFYWVASSAAAIAATIRRRGGQQ